MTNAGVFDYKECYSDPRLVYVTCAACKRGQYRLKAGLAHWSGVCSGCKEGLFYLKKKINKKGGKK